MHKCFRLWVLLTFSLVGSRAWSDVSASKANGYVVLSPPDAGVSASKTVAYAVLDLPLSQPSIYIFTRLFDGSVAPRSSLQPIGCNLFERPTGREMTSVSGSTLSADDKRYQDNH